MAFVHVDASYWISSCDMLMSTQYIIGYIAGYIAGVIDMLLRSRLKMKHFGFWVARGRRNHLKPSVRVLVARG